MPRITRLHIGAGTIAIAVGAGLPAGATAQEVGKASAVNPAATANTRIISIGQSITHKERIQTTAAGSVQLLFVDKTSMTIGPNSDLTIDEYVYNPNAGTGKLAATLGKGALRFVGGQISHSGEAEIKTASAVIGIRGGVALIGPGHVYAGYGSSTVQSGGATVTLGAGEFTATSNAGLPPTPPAPPPPGFVAGQIRLFQSSGGQTGGAPRGSATPAAVARAESRATGSPNGTVAQVAPVNANGQVHVGSGAPPPVGFLNGQQGPLLTSIVQSVQTSRQDAIAVEIERQADANPPGPPDNPPGPNPPPPPPPRQFFASAFALTMTNAPNSSSPFLPAAFAGSGNSSVSPVLGYRPASTGTAAPALFFQYGINITGVGAAQSSWLSTAVGSVTDEQGALAVSGSFHASRRGAGVGENIGFAGGPFRSTGPVGQDSAGLPTSATIQNSAPAIYNLGDGGGGQTYGFTQDLQRVPTPEGLGSNRPAVTLTAFTAGTVSGDRVSTGQHVSGTVAVGFGSITLDPTSSRMQANFSFGSSSPGTNLQFGSIDPNQAPQSAYVDYNNFAAREAIAIDPNTGVSRPVSTFADKTPNSHNGEMITITPAVERQLAPALSTSTIHFCQCDLTRWGFWSSQAVVPGGDQGNIALTANLVPWVAGQLPTLVEMPTVGTATYGGHVVANVVANSDTPNWNQYVAAGNLMVAVNFGSRSGSAVVTGFDQTNYSGAVALNQADPRQISASLGSQDHGRTMVLDGTFFRGADGPAGEMGGTAVVTGANYLASGVFAASTRGVTPVTYTPQAFAMSMSNAGDSNVPYLPTGFFPAGAGAVVSPVLGYRQGSVGTPAGAATLQYGISINGQGAGQSSSLLVATGRIYGDGSGGLVDSGGFFASRRGAADIGMGRANGTFSSPQGAVVVGDNGLPSSLAVDNKYYVGESRSYVDNPAFAFQGGGAAAQNYAFNQTSARIATPTGLGTDRPAVTLNGYTGGLMRTINTDNSTFIGPSFATAGFSTVTLEPGTSRMQANFNVYSAQAGGDALSYASIQLGSTDTSQRAEGSYIDYNNFGARRQVAVTNTQTGAVAPVSTVNGGALLNHNAAMVNAGPSDVQQFAAATGTNVTFCQCEYTRWGFWSNDSQRTGASGATVADRGNLMTWVAGRRTTMGEVPTTGIATYDGHVIASIKNGQNEYVAAGSMINTVNFGSRSGSVTVTGLDNTNYVGSVAISSSDPRNFVAGLGAVGGSGRSLALTGEFFRGAASPVGEMGGAALINGGAGYIGSGIFAGKMR